MILLPMSLKKMELDSNQDPDNSAAKEIWWKGFEFLILKRCSLSFFNSNQLQTSNSRWLRAMIRVSKVGNGLCKYEKAQILAPHYWLEAIDPYHRYGYNLLRYYNFWKESETNQPFFYWLDIGDGKEEELESCSRTQLQQECIKYLGPKEREAYEVIIENGKLVYKQTRVHVNTSSTMEEDEEGSEWIFVVSTSMDLYVGEKKKGYFQHSSFLSGAATIASGKLVALNGILQEIWSKSGHYKPTPETLLGFCRFLEDHNVNLTDVKLYNYKKNPFQYPSPSHQAQQQIDGPVETN